MSAATPSRSMEDLVLGLWARHLDTNEIARLTGVAEADVCRLIQASRDVAREMMAQGIAPEGRR